MGRKALINSNITHSVSTVSHITRGIFLPEPSPTVLGWKKKRKKKKHVPSSRSQFHASQNEAVCEGLRRVGAVINGVPKKHMQPWGYSTGLMQTGPSFGGGGVSLLFFCWITSQTWGKVHRSVNVSKRSRYWAKKKSPSCAHLEVIYWSTSLKFQTNWAHEI